MNTQTLQKQFARIGAKLQVEVQYTIRQGEWFFIPQPKMVLRKDEREKLANTSQTQADIA